MCVSNKSVMEAILCHPACVTNWPVVFTSALTVIIYCFGCCYLHQIVKYSNIYSRYFAIPGFYLTISQALLPWQRALCWSSSSCIMWMQCFFTFSSNVQYKAHIPYRWRIAESEDVGTHLIFTGAHSVTQKDLLQSEIVPDLARGTLVIPVILVKLFYQT